MGSSGILLGGVLECPLLQAHGHSHKLRVSIKAIKSECSWASLLKKLREEKFIYIHIYIFAVQRFLFKHSKCPGSSPLEFAGHYLYLGRKWGSVKVQIFLIYI